MGRILVLVGPSGSGKTSIAGELLKNLLGARMVTSITTREYRDSDLPGEYRYLSGTGISRLDTECVRLWSEWHGGNQYLTTKSSVLEVLDDELATGIMILIPSVLPKLQDFIATQGRDASVLLPIFIVPPPPEILLERLLKRGGLTEETIKQRMKEECDWSAEARAPGSPYTRIHNSTTLSDAVKTVINLLNPESE